MGPGDRSDIVIAFIFGGAAEWYQQKFDRTPDEGFEEKKAGVCSLILVYARGL